MSAITNQKRIIDAAVSVGVKHFIPAEFTVGTYCEYDPSLRYYDAA
jgi:hypothetical protein